MQYGYARSSKNEIPEDQLGHQVESLNACGCESLVADQAATSLTQDRPGLTEVISRLKTGDTLVVTKLDRLGRSIKGFIELVNDLEEKGAFFVALRENIDTRIEPGRFAVSLFQQLEDMDKDLQHERTTLSRAIASKKMRAGGRPTVDKAQLEAAKQMIESGQSVREVAKILGIGQATLYRHVGAKATQAALVSI